MLFTFDHMGSLINLKSSLLEWWQSSIRLDWRSGVGAWTLTLARYFAKMRIRIIGCSGIEIRDQGQSFGLFFFFFFLRWEILRKYLCRWKWSKRKGCWCVWVMYIWEGRLLEGEGFRNKWRWPRVAGETCLQLYLEARKVMRFKCRQVWGCG